MFISRTKKRHIKNMIMRQRKEDFQKLTDKRKSWVSGNHQPPDGEGKKTSLFTGSNLLNKQLSLKGGMFGAPCHSGRSGIMNSSLDWSITMLPEEDTKSEEEKVDDEDNEEEAEEVDEADEGDDGDDENEGEEAGEGNGDDEGEGELDGEGDEKKTLDAEFLPDRTGIYCVGLDSNVENAERTGQEFEREDDGEEMKDGLAEEMKDGLVEEMKERVEVQSSLYRRKSSKEDRLPPLVISRGVGRDGGREGGREGGRDRGREGGRVTGRSSEGHGTAIQGGEMAV